MADAKITRKESQLVGIIRLLKEQGQLATVQRDVNQALSGRSVDIKVEQNYLVITGQKDDVQTALQYFRGTFRTKVCYDRVEISETDLNCDIFSSPSKCDLVAELEKKHGCVIELRTKGPKKLSDLVKDLSSGTSGGAWSEITVTEGSLVEFQADVLVNPICSNSKDLSKCGPLSAAFLKFGGQQLNDDYGSLQTPVKFGTDVVATDAYNLLAKKVYHAAMRKYLNQQSRQMLQSMIATCLKMAQTDGMNSIAFPTVGCGNLGYQTHDVIECFLRAAESVGGLQIYIVAYDNSIFEVFKEKCQRSETSVVFHINAMSDDVIRKVREELKGRAMNIDVSVTVQNNVVRGLTPETEKEIGKLQSPSKVRIDIDKTAGRLTMTTLSHLLDRTKSAVEKILAEEERRLSDPRHILKTKGTFEYLQALAGQQIAYPSHWTSHTQRDSTIWNDSNGNRVSLNSSTQIYRDVEKLVVDTWTPGVVGAGNDAAGLTHKNIAVKQIWRIENPRLYHRYRQKMKGICHAAVAASAASATAQPFPLIKTLDKDEVKTRVLNLQTLESELVPEINEYFLLHGTKVDTWQIISKQGLDSRLAANDYFGSGIYFAESSTKSDQYADNSKSRTPNGTLLYMYVVRVLLGNPYLALRPYKFKRPPCAQPGCTNADLCKIHTDMHDSVVGINRPDGSRLLFREFIVYHPDQSYPEYLVEYVRQ